MDIWSIILIFGHECTCREPRKCPQISEKKSFETFLAIHSYVIEKTRKISKMSRFTILKTEKKNIETCMVARKLSL